MKPVEFDPNAFDDLAWWIQQDRKTALRIVKLIKSNSLKRFSGLLLRVQVNQNLLSMICKDAGHDALPRSIGLFTR